MSYQRKVLLAWLCLLLLFLTGCLSNGYLYTKIKVPYTINLDNTPVVPVQGEGRIVQINEPFSGYGFYTRFDSNAIGDIAKNHGLKKVYFADKEIFSILGIWRHEKIFLYGE